MELINHLRIMSDPKQVGSQFHPLYSEAADEIERLRDVLVMVTETVGTMPLATAVAIKAALER